MKINNHDARCVDWYRRLIADGTAEDGQRIAVEMYDQLAATKKENTILQKTLALSCRIIGEIGDCPLCHGGIEKSLPECDDGHNCTECEWGICWQKHLLYQATTEGVCRICGCTQNNACTGGCLWVEDDLCSSCAETTSPVELPDAPIHHLKTIQPYYNDSASGAKSFEVRKNDRDYAVGDILHLREWTGSEYTARSHYKRVTYILSDQPYVPEGYYCMAVELIKKEREQNG